MQMVAIGAADTHLTANASVTFFRTRVQKCTNFAYESILQIFPAAGWGTEMHVTLNRTGDLIYWMYVVLDLPGIAAVSGHSSNNLFRGGNNQFPSSSACDPCDDKKDDKKHPFNDPFDDGFEDGLDDGFVDPDINTCTGLKPSVPRGWSALALAPSNARTMDKRFPRVAAARALLARGGGADLRRQ